MCVVYVIRQVIPHTVLFGNILQNVLDKGMKCLLLTIKLCVDENLNNKFVHLQKIHEIFM